MKIAQKLLLTTGVSLLLGTSSLLANMESPQAIAKKIYQDLDSHQNYAFDATIVNHVNDSSNTHLVKVKVNRPNKLRIDVNGDIQNRSNYLNDGDYTVYDHTKTMYTKLKTTKNIDKALDNLYDRFEIKAPLAQLIYSGMHKRIKFNRSKNFGIVELQGVKYHYIAFADKTKEIHMWVTAEKTPKVKYYKIMDKTSKNNAYKSVTINWKDASSISAKDFVFKAPKNSTEAFIK